MENYKLGCVIMAAGNSSRFGRNKLLTEFQGKTLIERTFDAIPEEFFEKIIVVTQYPEIKELSEKKNFLPIINGKPEWGISYTVKLGTNELSYCDAIMYMVSDQPYLDRESISSEIEFFLKNRNKIVSASFGGKRGNPCIFPKRFFTELMSLSGDKGGSVVISKHTDDLMLFEISKEQLIDVDSQSDLMKLNNI